ncbi:DUF4209 domain-containing protein [Haemophilus sputorum]|jgi:hypothetical protein|uniref:DUF4209 domain-containing protein n=1 Tax=Haemophilus sputorum TaxID=1078480 RepID=UPI002107C374|nr:DUF4209 domain-containing protein [Haemophilus sputorum]MCQ1856518.1 DUF4209 domain-containing protein [Haemophilus sputorum]
MEELNFVSKEDFCIKVNEIFSELSNEEQLSLVEISSNLNKSGNCEIEPELKKSLLLLANICLLKLNSESRNDPFQPFMTYGNKRSFLPIDLTDEEILYLSSIVDEDLPPILKARIADILWTYSKPKNKKHSEIAIENYISMDVFDDFFEPDVYVFWERAVMLAKQTKNSSLIEKIKSKLLNKIDNPSTSWNFHLLKIIEIFDNTDLDKGLNHELAEKLLEKQKEFNHEQQFHIAEQYLELAAKLFKKSGNEEDSYKSLALLSQATENHGDYRKNESAMVANSFYKLALQRYREIPNSYRNTLQIDQKLDTVQDKITQSGLLITDELQLISTKQMNISELQEQSINHVKDKQTAFESLLYFSGVSSCNFESIWKSTERYIQNSVVSSLFGATSVSLDGRKISSIPPLALDGNNKDEVILKTAIKNFGVHIHLAVEGCILPALNQIQEEHIFPKDFLVDLCKLSDIVPEKREILVTNALYQGFEWDFRSAIHLLAPQAENMVRQLLKRNRFVTTHIDQNGIENEMGLSSLVSIDGAREILGDDLWFELQAVFTDSLSANLRNEVGHGLLDDDTSNSLYSIYAWWMVLRLVVRNVIPKS